MMENDSVNATPHGGANGQRMQTSLGRTSGPTRRSTKGQWTAKEDNLLCEAVQRFNGKNWKKIAECFKDRTDVQCLHRWQKVLNPELVKGPWTKEEDEAMIELVKKYGAKKWSTIAQHLPGRIGKQCRERWHNHLNPNINKEAWTQEEELTLIHAHQMYGNKWAELTKFLPGRSDNSIKNHWNSSVRKKIDSYFSSGLLAQFQGLPRICEANQSLPSPCSTVPQSSEDESVIREEAEREEISECSQSSSVLGLRSVDNILVREDFQLSKAPTYGEKPAYFEEHTVFSVPEVPYEMGGSSKYGDTIISMDLGEDFLMNCDFNVPENNEYVPFPLESPADITAVSSMAKPDHIISEDDCYRVIFPDTDMDGYCVSANINEGSNINDSSGPFPARTHFFTHESTLLCSSEFNPFNDISHQNGDLELEKGPDDFKSNAYYKVDENELNAENDSLKLVSVDISNLESSSNNQSFAMHHDPVHSNNLVKTIPNDVSIDTCPPEVQSLDKNDNGSLFYEPPRFPSLDIPFFSCDLIQAGDHTQQEYSPLGIRQLMMSSVNCFSPIRLWDSPKERDSNNADAVLKSAAKTFTITPSILKKRNRGCVSPLSEKRNKNKLETGMDRVLLSNLARDFSRQDVMFSQNGNVAHDKENMNCVPNSMTHPQTENEKNIGDEVKPGNSAVNTKSKGDLDTMAKAVPQPLGVLVEHDTNDLLFFSPEKPENRSDRISYGNNCTEKFNSSSRDPYIGDAVSLSPLGLKTDDKRQLKPAMSAQSSMALDPPRLMARSKDVAENLSMFGETPLKRSYDSPSAWKSPWFMNSFLPGPRVDTDITIEDIGYFLSPGDRSVDAIGLMKQLSMQSANALADAQEVLGDETPETYLKCRRSIDRKRIQDNTATFHSSTQSLLEPNALTEKRILDFSDCGTPGKFKENSKVLTSIGTCSPSSYLLKGAVK